MLDLRIFMRQQISDENLRSVRSSSFMDANDQEPGKDKYTESISNTIAATD